MDQKLLFLINREWTHPVLDSFMALLSSWAVWWPVVVAVVILVAIRGGFRARAFLIVALLAAGVADGLVSKTLKQIVDKPRPHQALEGIRQVDLRKASPRILALAEPARVKISKAPTPGEFIEGRSFPSSHMANTTAVATVAVAFFRLSGLAMFLVPLGVGYSRIYTGSHYPIDIFASLFIGVLTAIFVLRFAGYLWTRYGGRFLPRVHALHPFLAA